MWNGNAPGATRSPASALRGRRGVPTDCRLRPDSDGRHDIQADRRTETRLAARVEVLPAAMDVLLAGLGGVPRHCDAAANLAALALGWRLLPPAMTAVIDFLRISHGEVLAFVGGQLDENQCMSYLPMARRRNRTNKAMGLDLGLRWGGAVSLGSEGLGASPCFRRTSIRSKQLSP